MRRNANGASNLFAPVEIGEEVLAEALACHVGNSVAGRRLTIRLQVGWRAGWGKIDVFREEIDEHDHDVSQSFRCRTARAR
jgi:hypothetical protein